MGKAEANDAAIDSFLLQCTSTKINIEGVVGTIAIAVATHVIAIHVYVSTSQFLAQRETGL